MKDFFDMWYIHGGLRRVMVCPVQQQRTKKLGPITVWRDEWGRTYSDKHIREWSALSADQKIKAYRDAYNAAREDALWRITKDPELEAQFDN